MITIPEMYIPIVRDVRTKDELDRLREQLNELEGALFYDDTSVFEHILEARFSQDKAAILKDIFAQMEFKNNPEALKTFFQHCKNTLDSFVLLRMSIAFKPSEGMIDRLHEWAQKNLGIGVALDVGYEGSILGGARIIFNGRYKEMTLTQMITDVLTKEKAAVMEMIK